MALSFLKEPFHFYMSYLIPPMVELSMISMILDNEENLDLPD